MRYNKVKYDKGRNYAFQLYYLLYASFVLEIRVAVIASGKSEICQSRHFTTYYMALEFDLSRPEQSFPPDGETLI